MRNDKEAGEPAGGVEAVVRRRHRSKQERRRIAEESLQSGVSVAVLARRYDVNANQVFHWRKLLREGRLEEKPAPAQLIPVKVTEVVEQQFQTVRGHSGSIQVELGRMRIRIEGAADPASLRAVLEHLSR